MTAAIPTRTPRQIIGDDAYVQLVFEGYQVVIARPVAWVIPGDDNANANGFIDAMAWHEDEFSRPLYGALP